MALLSNLEDTTVTESAKAPLAPLPFEFQWIVNPELLNSRFVRKARTEPRVGHAGFVE